MGGHGCRGVGGGSPSAVRGRLTRGGPGSGQGGVADLLHSMVPSSERWRAHVRYALLGTALLTSPILLPFVMALLMLALRGTPLGAATLERLHLVYIGSTVYCLAALAVARLVCRSAPDERDRGAQC